MSTYVIGDVQGCFDALKQLLCTLSFSEKRDSLWFAGDLVNRGKQSLAVLRFVRDLGERAQVVLGNHDLHLLSVFSGKRQPASKDTFNDILTAPDADELCQWLQQQPLLYHDAQYQITLVHAGLPPQWNLHSAKKYANEITAVLQGDSQIGYDQFFQHLYGNTPDLWTDSLTNIQRLRFITNALTRIRYVDQTGRLDLDYKGAIKQAPSHLIPWFSYPGRLTRDERIIFGHWAALNGQSHCPNAIAIDTGCCWGGCLSAYCLETTKITRVKC